MINKISFQGLKLENNSTKNLLAKHMETSVANQEVITEGLKLLDKTAGNDVFVLSVERVKEDISSGAYTDYEVAKLKNKKDKVLSEKVIFSGDSARRFSGIFENFCEQIRQTKPKGFSKRFLSKYPVVKK